MKKLIAMLLAIVMVLSFATVAFADETTGPELKMESKVETVGLTLNKLYTVTGNTAKDLYPAEKLTFTSTPQTTNPDYDADEAETDEELSFMKNLTIADLQVSAQTGKMAITLPAYDQAGKYTYIITEDEGNTQGVTYSEASIKLTVLVSYDYIYDYEVGKDDCNDTESVNYGLKTEIVLSSPNDSEKDENDNLKEGQDGKLDTFTNKYDLGSMSVKKEVSGNLASQSALFTIKVTLASDQPVLSAINYTADSSEGAVAGSIETTEWNEVKDENDSTKVVGYTAEVTLNLKHDATVTFTDLPVGVTYTVQEDNKHLLAAGATVNPNSDADKEYTVTYSGGDINSEDTVANAERKSTGAISAENEKDDVVVANEKSTSVETGITLDSVPYIVMLAVAACGMVVFMTKKRHED